MNQYNNDLIDEDAIIGIGLFLIALIIILIIVIIRNWYNLYKKRAYRKLNKNLQSELEIVKSKSSFDDFQIQLLEKKCCELEKDLVSTLQQLNIIKNRKDKEISKQQEIIDNQKNAYEKYVNFKTVEANNTRLGAHFIKNVISQIYVDLEKNKEGFKYILGIPYAIKTSTERQLSLKALKNIFKLLDYNVYGLSKDKIKLIEELDHIKLFLALIQYLKPNAKIEIIDLIDLNRKDKIYVKPTIFFPFIENALKHGSLNNEKSFINIIVEETKDHQLVYTLNNSIEMPQEKSESLDNHSGFGLNALNQLLSAYYPGSKLEHQTLGNEKYVSRLTLKMQ